MTVAGTRRAPNVSCAGALWRAMRDGRAEFGCASAFPPCLAIPHGFPPPVAWPQSAAASSRSRARAAVIGQHRHQMPVHFKRAPADVERQLLLAPTRTRTHPA